VIKSRSEGVSLRDGGCGITSGSGMSAGPGVPRVAGGGCGVAADGGGTGDSIRPAVAGADRSGGAVADTGSSALVRRRAGASRRRRVLPSPALVLAMGAGTVLVAGPRAAGGSGAIAGAAAGTTTVGAPARCFQSR